MKPEAMLLSQAKNLLGYTPHLYFARINTGLIQNTKNKFYRSAAPGTPDLLVGYKGKFIAIELKSPRGKQSEIQKYCQQKVEDAQCEYWLIRSLEELQTKLNAFK